MKKITKRAKKVEAMRFRGNEATRYGNRMERFAREKYLLHHQEKGNLGLKVIETGLVISPDNPWLAASPDNRVYDPNFVVNTETDLHMERVHRSKKWWEEQLAKLLPELASLRHRKRGICEPQSECLPTNT